VCHDNIVASVACCGHNFNVGALVKRHSLNHVLRLLQHHCLPVGQRKGALDKALGEHVAGRVRALGELLAALALNDRPVEARLQHALALSRRSRSLHSTSDAARLPCLALHVVGGSLSTESLHLGMSHEDLDEVGGVDYCHLGTLHEKKYILRV